MHKDITSRNDLEKLFTSFYALAMNDKLIGHFFTEVIPIDLKEHLPHILDFWEANLWGKIGYKKNILQLHLDIHQKSNMQYKHFDQWLTLLNHCIEAEFKGPFANKLKTNALSIATVMKTKTTGHT